MRIGSVVLRMSILACSFLVVMSSSSYALESRKIANDPRMDKVKGDLEYVSKQEQQEVAKYLELKSASQKATAEYASINKKIQDTEARQKIARAQAESARAEYAQAQLRYDKAIEESKAAQDLSQQAIIRLYQESSNPKSTPSIYSTNTEEIQGAVRSSILVKKYNDDQIQVITQAGKKADDANKEKLTHDDARLRAEAAEKVASDEEASLVPLRAELAAAQKAAKDNEAAEQAIVKSLQSKKAEYQKQMTQLQAESDALAAAIRKKQQQSTNPTPVAPGKMIKPVNAVVTSSFGYRTHPIYGDQRLHAGTDFGASYGTAIKAAKAGTVIYVSEMSGYGNVIIIDHGGGLSTLYAHQSAFAVGMGASVSQGQVIGYVGSSGNVTGPHLHFEVRVNGTPVDPMNYF